MSKLNNKGFAISTIMYMILVVVVILLTLSLSILSSRRLILDGIKEETIKVIYDENNSQQDYSDQSGANVPDLMNNALTPVIYDGNNWKIADKSQEWYDYNNQWWANAVILSETGKSKQIGETLILPTSTDDAYNSDVKAMFVWIPRYEYKIEGKYGKDGTSATSPGEIEINFIDKATTEASSEEYTVHPAFNFGGEQLSGIWVGKFEPSHTTKSKGVENSDSKANLGCVNETCLESDNLRILPNIPSLRYNSLSSMFYAARSMSRIGNAFGIDNTISDSHVMRNSEWGAVAYLTQSKYGKYGNGTYEKSEKEVYVNNSSNYYTGRSGGAPGGSTVTVQEQYPDDSTSTNEYYDYGYYTYDGYKIDYSGNITEERDINKGAGASTTGNITGIYDMSGGAEEYVMGYLTTAYINTWGARTSGGIETDYAKFASRPDDKYLNEYTSTASPTACNDGVCYGQALSETAGWYGDYAIFSSNELPWFKRGGSYSYASVASISSAGVFTFYFGSGRDYVKDSFRIVIFSTT